MNITSSFLGPNRPGRITTALPTDEREVPKGVLTDFYKATLAKEDETPVFSWVEYPDRATRDAANKKMQNDPEMAATQLPFDGKRMFWGAFEQIVNE